MAETDGTRGPEAVHLHDLARAKKRGTKELTRRGKVTDDVPPELLRALRSVVCLSWFLSISSVLLLLLSGFSLFGFKLDRQVQLALVGGVSLEYVAVMLSPLVRGITRVLIARIWKG